MGPFKPSYFLTAANILLLVAYSVRDILWLRLQPQPENVANAVRYQQQNVCGGQEIARLKWTHVCISLGGMSQLALVWRGLRRCYTLKLNACQRLIVGWNLEY